MDKKNHYKQQIAYFDKEFSSTSDYKLAAWQNSYIKKIKKYVLDNNFKNKVLLDVGTGSGYVAIELAKHGIKVIACDLSPQAIENLEKYKKIFGLKNLKLLVCNAENLPIKNASVDYVVSNALLEHLPNEEKAISEWKRVLKKGGRMLVTVPLSLKFVWPFLWPINMLYDRRLGHLRRYTADSLKKKFKLKVCKTLYTGHLLKVLGVILTTLLKTHVYDEFLEKQDSNGQNIAYGANNITVIFEK